MMRIFAALCLMMYAYFISVQFNDLDAWVWIVGYGLVWLASLAVLLGVRAPWVFRLGAVPYVAWGIVVWMQTSGRWFDGELEREAAGLGICAVTLLTYSFARRRHIS